MSACKLCEGGACKACKSILRSFRTALRRAMLQPAFARAMKAVGEERSDATERSPEGRVLAGGLPLDVRAESLLMSCARSIQGERRNAG